MYYVQGKYNGWWEDLTAHDTRTEAQEDLDSYDENEIGYPHRIKYRNEPVGGS